VYILNISLTEPQNFARKYSLTVELLIWKYRWQNIPVSLQSGSDLCWLLPILCVRTVQLLTCETPDFILQSSGRPTVLTSAQPSRVDYRIWGKLHGSCTAAEFMTSPNWSRMWSKSKNISNRSSMKQSGSDVHVFKLVFEHVEAILNTDFKYVWLLHLTVTCLNVDTSRHFMFSSELAKLALTFADVDRFYWNLVICMQLTAD